MPDHSTESKTQRSQSLVDEISAASFAVALRDLQQHEGYARKILAGIARKNFELAMTLLKQAKTMHDTHPDGEEQFLLGVLTVIAAESKQEEIISLQKTLAVTSLGADGGASDQPLAA